MSRGHIFNVDDRGKTRLDQLLTCTTTETEKPTIAIQVAALIMEQKRTTIALAHLATTSQFEAFEKAATLVDLATALQVLLSYTPLFTSSSDLAFVRTLTETPNNPQENHELLEVIDITSDLKLLVDSSEVVIDQRWQTLELHMQSESGKYHFQPNSTSLLLSWVQAMTRKLSSQGVIDQAAGLHALVEEDSRFQKWWDTVLVPFNYINAQGFTIDLLKFEFEDGQTESDRAILIISTLFKNSVNSVHPPFLKFLKSCDKELLYDIVRNPQLPPITTNRQLRLYNDLITNLFGASSMKEESVPLILDTYQKYPQPNVRALESIQATLSTISLSYESSDLHTLANSVNAALSFPLSFTNLSELTSLSADPAKQETFFSGIIDSLTSQSASAFLSQTSKLKPALFPNVTEESARKLVMSRLLSLRLYSSMEVSPDDEDMVVEHFWTCFKMATNGSKNRGELNAAYRALKMLSPPSQRVKDLLAFVDAVDELFKYSIYFKRGTPLKPIDLLSIDDLQIIAQKILELNNNAYESPEEIYQLLTQLSLGLQATVPPKVDITCLCIVSSLAELDFEFAYDTTNSLLESESNIVLKSKWDTFFQVAKFTSPDWIDTETPTEVIQQQMSLLGAIVGIAPTKHVQDVVSQWNMFDTELSLREEGDEEGNFSQSNTQSARSLDQRLARSLASTAAELLNEGNGLQVSNLLTSGLDWAIGASRK